MQDPEFEKIVKQKMEELNFNPPEVIWGKVELEIKDKQRSKRIFWFLLFFGLLGAGGAYILLTEKNRKTNQLITTGNAGIKFSRQSSTMREKPVPVLNLTHQQIDIKKPADVNNSTANKSKLDLVRDLPVQPGIEGPGSKGKQVKPSNGDEAYTARDISASKEKFGLKNAASKNPLFKNTPSSTKFGDVDPAKNKNQSTADVVDSKSLSVDNQIGPVVGSGRKNTSAESESKPLRLQASPESAPPSKKDSPSLAQLIHTDSAMKGATGTKTKQSERKRHSWAIGVTLSPGVSGMENGIFRSRSSTDAPAYAANSSNGSASGGYPSTPSAIRPDFSLLAGAFIQKTIAGRWSLVVGLNYHYFSTRIKTGYKIDSLPAGFTNTTYLNIIPAAINSYYLSGDNKTYTNHFHFIEIPVALQWHLNRNRRLPIAWEAGLTISQLIASDALHFDQTSGIYYPNNGLFNKTQVGASSAVLIGFYLHDHLLQVGPTIQYGVSNFLISHSGDNQHLFNYGIKFTMLSRKNGILGF